VRDVVVAIAAQGLAELDVGITVRLITPQRLSVLAFATSTVSWVAAAGRANRVDGTETRRGQRHKHLGMIGHGRRDVVMSTPQPSVDELPGITRVQIRARGADDGQAVKAIA
jgi:hypothetical protein